MRILTGINRFIGLFVTSLSGLSNRRIWGLLAGYFAVQALVLFAHYDFISPIFFGVISFWTSLFGDQAATGFTHYPGQMRLLPYFYGWAKFVVGLLLEGLVLGGVAYQFTRNFWADDDSQTGLKGKFFVRWINLSLGWLIINGIVALLATKLPEIVGPFINGSPRRTLAFEYVGLPGLYIIVTALFLYVIPLQVIYRINFLRSVGDSLRLVKEHPVTSFFLSAVILAGPILVSFVTSRPSVIVERFRPELVFWVLLVGLAVEMVANFFWMGTTVQFIAEEES